MTPRALAAGTGGHTSRHLPVELARIEAYSIRYAVTAGDRLPLGSEEDGTLDSTAVAIESTMRERSGLPSWIRELDAPAEYRNPDPWDYCPPAHWLDEWCFACEVAQRAGLPKLERAPRPIGALAAALTRYLDGLTAWLAKRRAATTPEPASTSSNPNPDAAFHGHGLHLGAKGPTPIALDEIDGLNPQQREALRRAFKISDWSGITLNAGTIDGVPIPTIRRGKVQP